MTVDEVERLLKAAARIKFGRVLPFLALSLFSGMRRDEVGRITWAAISLDHNTIKLSSVSTKKSRRRVAEIPGNLAKILHLVHGMPIIPANLRRTLDAVCDAANVRLTQNVLRHTCITYRCISTGIDATADWSGTSRGEINTRYKGLVEDPKKAAEFWALTVTGYRYDGNQGGITRTTGSCQNSKNSAGNRKSPRKRAKKSGANDGTRTHDRRFTKPLLYH